MTNHDDRRGPQCKMCSTTFDGTRTEARRAGWEPYSFDSQHAIDRGPMACSDCIGRLLDAVLDAIRKAPASAWDA